MSLLIGVNDAAIHNSTPEAPCGVSAEEFEKLYTSLLEDIFSHRPKIKIMVLEPFLLPGSSTSSCKNNPDLYPLFRHEVEARANIVCHIAQRFALPFIELQNKFDEACKLAPANYWLYDGVHPTAMGHQLIAQEWMGVFGKLWSAD